MTDRILATTCPNCGTMSPIRADRLPLPILGLSVDVKIDASDAYMITVHDWVSDPPRHARDIVPHKTCTPQKVGETINVLLLAIAGMGES